MRVVGLIGVAALTILVGLALVFGQGERPWPRRDQPLSSTLGWFRAMNEHDVARNRSYLSAEGLRCFGTEHQVGSLTRLRCRTARRSATTAAVICSLVVTDLDDLHTVWTIGLSRHGRIWLVDGWS